MDLQRVGELVGKNIKIVGVRGHMKASESYIDVIFTYPNGKTWRGAIPMEYRRTGVHAKSSEEAATIINNAYDFIHPDKKKAWEIEQENFWNRSEKKVTREFFEALKDSTWKCAWHDLPRNPNWARRVQDIKEFGYTIASNTKMFCDKCKRNTHHLILLRLPRGTLSGYETWSPKLRERILEVLGNFDAYEGRVGRNLIPDHKFPEIRWDEKTRGTNPDTMKDEEIKRKFQLLTNQKNLEKREVCRRCFQTGKRGTPFSTKFFYEGGEDWPNDVPKTGKDAERGCHGCGWYDLCKWKEELNKKLTSRDS